MNFDGMNTFVPAMCPNCSAHMKVDSSTKIARCESCGTECLVQDAIKTLNVSGTVHVGSATINLGFNTVSLLQRVEILLADGDFNGAMEKCEIILDTEPTNAQAYIYKLMASLKVKRQDDLANCQKPFDDNSFYQNAYRFGDDNIKATLKSYIYKIKERIETERLTKIYNDAVWKMKHANTPVGFVDAANGFEPILNFRDSRELKEICLRKSEELKDKEAALRLEAMRMKKARMKVLAFLMLGGVVVVIVAVLFFKIFVPKIELNNAMKMLDAGNYSEAYEKLNKLGKNDIVAQNKYDRAVDLIASGDYEPAFILLKDLKYKDSDSKLSSILPKCQGIFFSKAKIGSSIYLGTYEQDNNTSNGKEIIEWIVLDKPGNKALVVSKYALDCQPYDTQTFAVTWKDSHIRKWLNNSFINDAFNSNEKARILETEVKLDKNPSFRSFEKGPTIDKVFLLSIREANKLIPLTENRVCSPTEYALSKGLFKYTSSSDGRYACCWWLRTIGEGSAASCVRENGFVDNKGCDVVSTDNGVRPAMWIYLD